DRILKFTGNFDFTLDAKGRVSTPARIREVLEIYAVNSLTLRSMELGEFDCIRAYPTSYYNEIILAKLTDFQDGETPDDTFEISLLTANAHQVKLDSQGRINIPDELLKQIEIKKEIRFIGMGNFFDIWRPDIFDAFHAAQLAKRSKGQRRNGNGSDRAGSS
ncbi:MAG: division/cell wall cluster transcriptional repressor MraZ, partial [bacterium]